MPKKKIRYKVVVYGTSDGLRFPDLLIKYSSGFQLPLQVKRGEYLPDDPEVLDPADIKKSIAAGSLGKYLKAGWVVEDDGRKPRKQRRRKKSQLKPTPVPPKPVNKEEQAVERQENNTSKDSQQKTESTTNSANEESQQAVNFTEVKSFADFNKIKGFWQRKQFIRVCKDKALLSDILNNVDSASQIANIIELRIEKLEKEV